MTLTKNDPDPNEVKDKKIQLTDFLTVSYLIFISYVCSYAYSSSYFEYFGIPNSFLNLSLKMSISFATVALVSIFIFLFFVNMLYARFYKNVGSHGLIIFVILSSIFFIAGAFFLFDPDSRISYIYSGLLLICSLIFLCLLLFIKPKSKGFKAQVEKQKDGLYYFSTRYGYTLAIAFMLTLLLFVVSVSSGSLVARLQKDFIVSNCYENTILINYSPDNFVGILYDKKTRLIGKELRLVSKEAFADTCYIKLEAIGRLKSEKPRILSPWGVRLN